MWESLTIIMMMLMLRMIMMMKVWELQEDMAVEEVREAFKENYGLDVSWTTCLERTRRTMWAGSCLRSLSTGTARGVF